MAHADEALFERDLFRGSAGGWEELVDQWRVSGLSQAEFSRRHGVTPAMFSRKKIEILGPGRPEIPARPERSSGWLEVRRSVSVVAPLEESLGEGFELVVGRRRVRLGPGFDVEGLRRLLEVWESLPC